jgi:hypothetical protein
MSDNMLISIIFPAVGVLLIVIAVILFIRTVIFLLSSKKVQGTIVRMAQYTDSSGSRYDPVFQFKTADGRTLEVEDSTGSNPPQFRVGQSVKIAYDPKNPSRAHINKQTNLFFAPLLLCLMGLCFACVGGVFFYIK